MNLKKCNTCGKELPVTREFFYQNKKSKDGFIGQCKMCAAEYYKKYSEMHKEEKKEKDKKYREKNRELLAERTRRYYAQNTKRILERRKQLGFDMTTYQRKWRKDNPEKKRTTDQKRRARKRQLPATLTAEQWQIIKKYFDNKCAYCGKQGDLQQDHFIALSKGGEYTINNIVPACRSCNEIKNNSNFFKWYPKYKYYLPKREKAILRFLGYNEQGMQQPSFEI